jgi:hypothetical protein
MRQQRNRPPKRPQSTYTLTQRDEQIIQALNRFFYLTTEQVTRLFYKKGSHTSVYGILSRLATNGYTAQQRYAVLGKGERLVNSLDRQGRSHLAKLGFDIPTRLRKSEKPTSPLFYGHTLAVNDFLIAAELLARDTEVIALESFVHELTFKREPIRVPRDGGKLLNVAPDGWLDFTITDRSGRGQACVLYECDRGTEEQTFWRAKVAGLLLATRGAYQERFGTQSLTIAVTTPSTKRRAQLIRWTEAELKKQQASQAISEVFHFTSHPADTTDPRTLFLSPVWYRPFDEQPYPLLEVHLA